MKKKTIVHTDKAPAAVGPYSQAVIFGDMVFTSGQIPLTSSGELVTSGIEDETRQVMENLNQVLSAAGTDFSHVLKATIFLTDLANFGAVNEIYGTYFTGLPPARSCVQVSALPKGAEVEIELISQIKE